MADGFKRIATGFQNTMQGSINAVTRSREKPALNSVQQYESDVARADLIGRGSTIFTIGAGIAAGVSATDTILKAAGTIAVVAGGAFPLALPIIAASALVISVFLQYYAGSAELVAFMNTISEQFSDIIDFFNLASIITNTMQQNNTSLGLFDFRLGKVKAYAKLFTKELLKYSPTEIREKMLKTSDNDAVIGELLKTTEPLKGLKGFLARRITAMKRFFASGAIMARLSRYFQNFSVACQATKDRFFLFIAMYPAVFNKSMKGILDPNHESHALFKKIFFLDPNAVMNIQIEPTAEDIARTLLQKYQKVEDVNKALEPVKATETVKATEPVKATETVKATTGGARCSRRIRRKQKHRSRRRKS